MENIVLYDSLTEEDIAIFDEILLLHEIKSGIYGQCGDWLISKEGDLICMTPELRKGYPIFSEQLLQTDWLTHLTPKSWFTKKMGKDFPSAYSCACLLARINDKHDV